MKSIKVNPGETFELIITDDKGIEIAKQCYAFDPATEIKYERKNGFITKMDIVPTLDYEKLFAGSKLFGQSKESVSLKTN